MGYFQTGFWQARYQINPTVISSDLITFLSSIIERGLRKRRSIVKDIIGLILGITK